MPGNAEIHATSRELYDVAALAGGARLVSGRSVLVLGGARSGKSRYGEGLALGHEGTRVYIATALPGDEEMAARIDAHRGRRGPQWLTVEAPIELVEALETAAGRFVLIDCLTLWISNLMFDGRRIAPEVERLAEALPRRPGTVVVVSNEVGLGIVPDNALARSFRDEAGLANQRLAQVCDEVVFMAAGLPLHLKVPSP